jgi:pilus assembly protein Flp/PilA
MGPFGIARLPKGKLHPRRKTMLSKLRHHLVRFLRDDNGPTAVEYAVMLALIIVVCVGAVTALGQNSSNTFSYVGTQVAGSGS